MSSVASATLPAARRHTPLWAGKNLWVDGWRPGQVDLGDGRTQTARMFLTGRSFEILKIATITSADRRSDLRLIQSLASGTGYQACLEALCRAGAPTMSEPRHRGIGP